MYPYLLNGTRSLGGSCDAPRHLDSYAGSFLNLVFEVAAQFAGAVATPEWLLILDHFARKDYGDNYLTTNKEAIHKAFNTVIYGLNEPAAARNYQAVFWNISIFDKFYFNYLFGDFVFPDFDKPKWETFNALQKEFMLWFNEERTKKILTFPVVTAARLDDGKGGEYDEDFLEFISKEASDGNAFFTYTSDSVDSLASCCRLRNEMGNKPQFSYSLGAGGVATGSVGVISLNLARLVQDKHRSLEEEIDKLHKYHIAYRDLITDYLYLNMLPVYSVGFISLDKQFSTIGIVGIADAALISGVNVGNNEEYFTFCEAILKTIYEKNREAHAMYGVKINTEQVPGESLGVKFAKWDKEAGYDVRHDCYNSYFYFPEDKEVSFTDKFILHGEAFLRYLDGGSALHLNLDDYPSQEGYKELFRLAARSGCNYFCTNIPVACCNTCGHIDKRPHTKCVKCSSEDIDYATRVIGYLKKVSSFSADRQKEASERTYHKVE